MTQQERDGDGGPGGGPGVPEVITKRIDEMEVKTRSRSVTFVVFPNGNLGLI